MAYTHLMLVSNGRRLVKLVIVDILKWLVARTVWDVGGRGLDPQASIQREISNDFPF